MFYLVPVDPVPAAIIEERESHYDVHGATEPDMVRDLNAKGPVVGAGHYWAYTSANVNFNYRTRQAHGACFLVSPSVVVSINIVYPQWMPSAPPTAAAASKWAKLDRAIHAHEGEHAQLAREQARSLVRLLRRHVSGKTCKALDTVVERESVILRQKSVMANEALDERTGHGLKEGVAISW
ncbi:DUF922 domain-containing protein [Luteibacter yeojuensis]|uniref:Secreted Zn-dependent protease n=1 Tax=Luteibacter yeojuensis TaxID=345309 RepID=A0A0F3KUB7_9GAMM|nr:DUF922 domain-containing protein [Luteibacter yeojuensis]KJV34756.1 hypothetical protein VI08_09185 [Luteibacter yeojuensis]